MVKMSLRFLIAFGIGLVFSATASAQSPVYYEGKTMRIVVGAAPGGGLDTYSRVIARPAEFSRTRITLKHVLS